MIRIELIPDLSQCIEITAKKEYENTLRQILATEANEQLEEKTETLKLFLQTADFKKLRAESEQHLLTGKNVRFIIYLKGGALKYDMQVEDL